MPFKNFNNLTLIPFIIILLYTVPYWILGPESNIRIHDNLDSNIANMKMLLDSGHIFSSNDTVLQNVFNGIPRSVLGSEFNIYLWLVFFFGPLSAYIINQIFIRFIAFVGMYFLLSRHIIKNDSRIILYGVPLAFSLLPFWPMGLLSIAGQPLLLYSFLNILNKKFYKHDLIIIILFPLYSSLVLAGSFIIVALLLIFINDFLDRNFFNKHYLLGLSSFIIIYGITNYRLIYSVFFDSSFISHRVAWDRSFLSYDLINSIKLGLSNLVFGHIHARSLHEPILIISLFLFVITLFKKNIIFDNYRKTQLFKLLSLILLISLFFGCYSWQGLLPLKDKYTILKTYQFDRFHMLHPILWYLVFSISLSTIRQNKHGKYFLYLLIFFQLSYISGSEHSEIFKNWKIIFNKITNNNSDYISYREFYSEDIFNEIDQFIGLPKSHYRTLSIGMHPAVAIYNGFYTLDGYFTSYPLEYKHQFRKLIIPELEKSTTFKNYFDSWGSRCYLFVSELEKDGFTITKDKTKKIKNFSINMEVFIEMGGQYIFSAVELFNAEEKGLILENIFTNSTSSWRIYLYKTTSKITGKNV